jgi:hypothetical protein
MQAVVSSGLLSKNIKIQIYSPIILPSGLYGCEMLLVTLRQDHRLMVFKNRVLMELLWPKKDKVIEEWRRLHNKEL